MQDAFRAYRDLDGRAQLEKAFHFRWEPDHERTHETELAALWEEMTPSERQAVVDWFRRCAESA